MANIDLKTLSDVALMKSIIESTLKRSSEKLLC